MELIEFIYLVREQMYNFMAKAMQSECKPSFDDALKALKLDWNKLNADEKEFVVSEYESNFVAFS